MCFVKKKKVEELLKKYYFRYQATASEVVDLQQKLDNMRVFQESEEVDIKEVVQIAHQNGMCAGKAELICEVLDDLLRLLGERP